MAATVADGELLYKGFLNLRYGMSLSFQEYYCVLTDTGVFTVYESEEAAVAQPTAFVHQVRLGGTKEWNGKTMFSTLDNSFKFITEKGKEYSATGHNRNEVTLWVKSIRAITDPDSHEGQKLAKAKRKQLRERERERQKQEEYEARARAHNTLPSASSTTDLSQPPISYLTDPRRTRLDARNFPKYRQHLQAAKLETRLTAALDETKPLETRKKKKKKRTSATTTSDAPAADDDDLFGAPPVSASAAAAPSSYTRKSAVARIPSYDEHSELTAKFSNLLSLGFSHNEVKAFMAADGHPPEQLNATSQRLKQSSAGVGSPTKKARRHTAGSSYPPPTPPPPVVAEPPKKVSFFDKLRSGFRRDG
ncbi:hypothetical protein H310_07273 [Aphanomyces invadans]|uniref:PH domain-containing protein n=1 Tax=Aphanomyces invadans TaxID=157072 RepID=A0A024U512_9STRA|nr:hypothetical protein H310_07273 [Aphanomyces invadans]ETW00718.1 hypothetical protein H310_07273 [Aphanomyces invadans]|eukprot:XP_008870853.1 hypothetical protein H310_07273 [Aphanomyces invadans]